MSQQNAGNRKILSRDAKKAIHEATSAGTYVERQRALEPPYMAPSESPEDYSKVSVLMHPDANAVHTPQWCTYCTNFGTVLVLCASCRIGLCVRTKDSPTGCLQWDGRIDDDDFIYHCPWCTWNTDKISPVCPIPPLCGADADLTSFV